jgi:uncharacterized protein YecA (UPF0149 family)
MHQPGIAEQIRHAERQEKIAEAQAKITQAKATAAFRARPRGPYKRTEDKTGRNDPCPCGSKKKFKKCCLHN